MRALWRFLGWFLLLVSLAVVAARWLFYEFPEIHSDAMSPSIVPGDTLVISKRRVPQRGEIALFEPPNLPGGLQVQRVVAVPGDSIEFAKGSVTVNDSLVRGGLSGKGFAKKKIEGYFVLVNATGIQDSRHFGVVQAAAVRGTATHILIPSKARQSSRFLEPLK